MDVLHENRMMLSYQMQPYGKGVSLSRISIRLRRPSEW
ncbi:hypothetical protein SXCC_00451 [Gluconacetobacter sp. SXCC-1]|nr:hypothetical protein SXCC_00451 [Gluconacetobacter sp. SXCC-1]